MRRTRTSETSPHVWTSVTVDFASEDVQTVDEMQHAIAVYAVVLVHGTAAGSQRAGDVALLTQDVVHLEAKGHVSFQERLGYLCVPYQFVAVHAAVPVASAALIGNVGVETHVPGRIDIGEYTVGKRIGILVVGRCQLVLLNGVGEIPVQAHLENVITVCGAQVLAQCQVGGGILLLDGVRAAARSQIAHVVGVSDVRECAYVELFVLQCRVETEQAEYVPISVDVLRHGCPSACRLVVGTTLADAVLRSLEERAHEDTSLQVGYIIVVEHVDVVAERRFQVRITRLDAQRIGVVGYRQQVLHAGLAASSAIGDTQLAYFGETHAEVDIRREIEHTAGAQCVNLTFLIRKFRVLRLERQTCVQLILRADEAQTDTGVMFVCLVFGILALVCVPMVKIVRRKRIAHFPSQAGEVVRIPVAFAIAILEAVAELQEGCLSNRFAISKLRLIAVVG